MADFTSSSGVGSSSLPGGQHPRDVRPQPLVTNRRKSRASNPRPWGVWDENLEELNNPLPRWWLNMFYITLVFGIGYLALYPGLGSFAGVLKWSEVGEYNQEVEAANKQFGPLYEKYMKEDLRALAGNREALKTGERLFVNYCTVCHGSDAGGGPGFPNLRDKDWLYGGDPEPSRPRS